MMPPPPRWSALPFDTRKTTRFILVHSAIWWLMIIAAKPGLDRYGDMLEVHAWSQHWLAGSDKHPQFLPWVAHLWFMVMPKTVPAFYLLSAVNLAVGLLGIAALGRALRLDEDRLLIALALTVLALPYLTLAGKLNMNAINLATWPWLAWAFIRATDDRTHPQALRALYAILLGALAAIAVLSKYYAGVLLLSLLIASLMPARRRIWAGFVPWLALAICLTLLAPHLAWLASHQEALRYAAEQGASEGTDQSARQLAKFALAPLFYWLVPLGLALGLFAKGSLRARLGQLLHLPRDGAPWGFLTVGPWLVTLLLSLLGLAVLSTPWAIPIGFAYMLWLMRNADPDRIAQRGPGFLRAFLLIWALMLIGGALAGMGAGWSGDQRHYRPEAEATRLALAAWHNSHDLPLSWVTGGDEADAFAFFAPGRIEVLPALPDRLPSYYPAHAGWEQEGGAIICALLPGDAVDSACIAEARDWAAGHDMRAEAASVTTQRTGLRFPNAMAFTLSLVHVLPE